MCLPKNLGGLGFTDLELFNQSLLSKQAWKLLLDKESLFAKVLKSRYYPDSEFLTATLGNRPSYGWRSILFGRELLEKGISKVIGNENSINVWLDPWIEDNGLRPPLIKNYPIDFTLRVCDLIDPATRSWKQDVLNDLFWPRDCVKIWSLHAACDMEDYWVWKHNRSGNFTVKSGYWLANQSNSSEVFREASTLPSLNDIKTKIWSIATELKIKTFIWRVLSDALPVSQNIIDRGMKADERCQLCGHEGESANHVLFSCPIARQTWALTLFPAPPEGFHQSPVYVNIHFLFTEADNKSLHHEIRRAFPWTLWLLWKNRNKFFFESVLSLPNSIAQKSAEASELWYHAHTLEDPPVTRTNDHPPLPSTSWLRPPTSWLKCNIGVVWCKRSRMAGCAWVLRSSDGTTLMHSRRAFNNIQDLMEDKLQGYRWTIEAMSSHRLDRIIFAAEAPDIFGAIIRPKAWPNFRYHAGELTHLLSAITNWRVEIEARTSNRSSFLIANSVIRNGLFPSYVARGHPRWLNQLFEGEKRASSR